MDLSINDRVLIKRCKTPKYPSKRTTLEGRVAYIGAVSFADGDDWVGCRLTGTSTGHGKNNGTVDGVVYFEQCGNNNGLFVRRSAVTLLTRSKSWEKKTGRVPPVTISNRIKVPDAAMTTAVSTNAFSTFQTSNKQKPIHNQSHTSEFETALQKVQKADENLQSARALFSELNISNHPPSSSLSGKITQATNDVNRAIEELSLAIADTDDFRELNHRYSYTHYERNRFGMRRGEGVTKIIEMDRPRSCRYNKKCYYDWKDDFIVESALVVPDLPPSTTTTTDCCSARSVQPVEYSGITLNQIRAVLANVERRCTKERWTNANQELLTPDTVSLYDVDKYIIRPYTVRTKQSFVNTLPSTAGPQPPRFFMSHWWGEPVIKFISCLEQLVVDFTPNRDGRTDRIGGGMTPDTPVWVCAYANNQWNLEEVMSEDPRKSSFTKAMMVAEGRTATVLDTEGVVFSRIWCCFELFLVFVGSEEDGGGDGTTDKDTSKESYEHKNNRWCVYNACKHTYGRLGGEERKAVGIIAGGAPIDQGHISYTFERERSFPFELIAKSPTIRIEDSHASQEADRVHILNAIVGQRGEFTNHTPPLTHPKYEEVNNALRARFVP